MTDLTNLTVAEIRDGHRAGDFSAVEVAEAFNANVAGAKALNAFIVETPEHAIAAAKQETTFFSLGGRARFNIGEGFQPYVSAAWNRASGDRGAPV